MQIPILNGVYTAQNADYKTSYPLNMMPVVQDTGISAGYLRPVEGIVKTGEGPGISRGAINWNGKHYRVMGSKLCYIDSNNNVTIIGDVGNNNKRVIMDYSFDRLAIASNGNLFYYDNLSLIQVTDSDLGNVLDVVWVDGYFMTTDGTSLVVTELSDPTSVNPLKYGSSEIDPDPINGILKLRNEIYAVNRYTIEVFDNVGGELFPFQRINGAQVQRGSMGAFCSIVYESAIAFLGSGRNESPAVYLSSNASTVKISTREIDEIINSFTETELSNVVLETLNDKGHALLWIRLPDRTLSYDLVSSNLLGQPVWYQMSSGILNYSPYRAKDVIWCYDGWQIGDTESSNLGILNNDISSHFGNVIKWEFGTKIIYNGGKGLLIKMLELVALTGRTQGFNNPVISTSYSLDGRTWSQDRIINIGQAGNRLKRLVWWRQGHMKNTRMQRFTGDSNAYLAISRLEVDVEPLAV
ncbi:MAG: packaged DNA stabilization protein [Cyclobacteriaceae bacterium]